MNTPALAARNWIDPFDRWHLILLPPALIVVGILLVALPKPNPAPTPNPIHRLHPGTLGETPRIPAPAPAFQPAPNAPTPNRITSPSPPSPQTQRLPPAAPAPMRPTRIESPSPNALFWRDRLGDVEGTAEPGSTVQIVLGQKTLARTTADGDGRYRFRLAGFPPGKHRIQIIATAAPNRQSADSAEFTVKADVSPRAKPATQTKPPAGAKPPKAKPAEKPSGKPAIKPKSPSQPTNTPAKPAHKSPPKRPAQ